MQVKLIFLELSQRGTSEVQITVSVGVNTCFSMGRGLILQYVQTSKFFASQVAPGWLSFASLLHKKLLSCFFFGDFFSLEAGKPAVSLIAGSHRVSLAWLHKYFLLFYLCFKAGLRFVMDNVSQLKYVIAYTEIPARPCLSVCLWRKTN